LEALLQFDTCTLANAIEKLEVRLQNEGYTVPGLRCMTAEPSRILGYGVTSKIRTSNPPFTGQPYCDRSDWWDRIETVPKPRIAVIQDIDEHPGTASALGAVHTTILRALQVEGAVTNGAVRDVPAISALTFPVFACGVAVSHAYRHMVDFGHAVKILGLTVAPGDLLMADCHGLLSIPKAVAGELPRVAAGLLRSEKRIIDLCQSATFTIDRLKALIGEIDQPA
jgi:regulator of RNase E activity RraA